jgi:Domain of unknown function (DUF4157)
LRAPSAVFAHPILQLQKTIGNQAVQDLLRSRAIQAKLAISQPGDPYEDEADRIAGQVMRMPDMPIQRTCSEGGSGASTCSACERKEQVVVRRRTDQSSARAGSIADDFVRNLGPGQPLDSATRVHFEPRFHRDFGDVRVHAGSRAAEMARQIHARAFTAGPNIVFGRDQYQPQSRAGQRLLAHELAHTLQQREDGFLMIQGDFESDFAGKQAVPASCGKGHPFTGSLSTVARFVAYIGSPNCALFGQCGRSRTEDNFETDALL